MEKSPTSKPISLSLAILVLNEVKGLKALWHQIPFEAVDEVFVVDGGSTDGTLAFLKEQGVTVYGQSQRGRAEAFRVAFEKSSCDAVLFFSPDGNEDPEDIWKFRPLLQQGFDMVIANRMTKGGRNEEDGQFFRWRKWANLAFTILANLAWNRGPFVWDTINGFRAIRRHAWAKIKPNATGYTIEYQCSIRAFKNQLKIVEFPTGERPRVDDRVGSPSIATGLAFLKLYWKELLV